MLTCISEYVLNNRMHKEYGISTVLAISKTYYTSQREIFHEPKASEISRHISQLTSVISALFL